MAYSHGNALHILDHLWGEPTSYRWILLTKCQQYGPFRISSLSGCTRTAEHVEVLSPTLTSECFLILLFKYYLTDTSEIYRHSCKCETLMGFADKYWWSWKLLAFGVSSVIVLMFRADDSWKHIAITQWTLRHANWNKLCPVWVCQLIAGIHAMANSRVVTFMWRLCNEMDILSLCHTDDLFMR